MKARGIKELNKHLSGGKLSLKQKHQEVVRECRKCRMAVTNWGLHHINGKGNDDRLNNKIRLCPRCHDLVQGICDKCQNQSFCSYPKFNMCWRFEDALPPIYFKQKIEEETSTISLTNEK